MAEQEHRADYIRALRKLIEFLEDNPHVPVPSYTELNVFLTSREDIVEIARKGSWEKIFVGQIFALRRTFSDHLRFDINVNRGSVCRKVVTGTKIVPAQPEHEVEEFEWVCDDALLSHSESKQ